MISKSEAQAAVAPSDLTEVLEGLRSGSILKSYVMHEEHVELYFHRDVEAITAFLSATKDPIPKSKKQSPTNE